MSNNKISDFKVRMSPMKYKVPKINLKVITAAINRPVSSTVSKSAAVNKPQNFRDPAADQIIKMIDTAKNKYNELYDSFGKEMFDKVGFKIRITDSLVWAAKKISSGQFVTRAWLKFYEIYCHFGLIERIYGKDGKVFAFLNAELPGASICALNHYIKTRMILKNINDFDWRGSSYVSQWGDGDDTNKFEHEKSSVSLEDKYGIWEKNQKNWLMEKGVNNGDATNIENLLNFRQKLGDKGVNLYSHDAGIDVSIAAADDIFGGAFENQEARNMRVHLGCAAAGLLTLEKGGVFIAKQYSVLERLNIDLLLVYAAVFEEFYLFKPVTSGASNSEIYLVGVGFLGLDEEIKKAIFARLDDFRFEPFLNYDNKGDNKCDNVKKAAADIIEFQKLYAAEQVEFIDQDIKYYKLGRDNINNLSVIDGVKYRFSKKFFDDNKLLRIDAADLIPANVPIYKNKK